MKSRRLTVIALLFGLFCFGCGQGALGPSVPVPAGCQKFLDKWFAAIKAKDIATFQELSSYIPLAQSKEAPEASMNMMRDAKKEFAGDSFQRMISFCGDFRSYSVISVKETTIPATDQVAANMMGAGTHTEIVCKARFTKKHSVGIGLHLLKETPQSEYAVLAWKVEAEL